MGDHAELHDVVVVDVSDDLAGAYCAKLFTDAGAVVTRVEPPGGDPWRRWQWSGEPTEADGALFRYLRHGQRSVVAEAGEASLSDLCAAADLVITGAHGPAGDPAELAARCPGTVVVALSPYGLAGPYADRPATEFTVQSDSGALALRGTRELPPFQMGGRVVEWVAGAYAGVASLAAVGRARRTGHGELVDLALCEVANVTGGNFADLFAGLAGRPPIDPEVPARTVEIPSIEPTSDGWIGVNTNTRDQWESFCILIERPDLLDDAEFASLAVRVARADEWNQMVREFTVQHPTAELVERAAALRIPVAPVSDGRSLLELDHPRERGVFLTAPDGDFTMPRRPYRFDGEPAPTPRPAPAVGEHTAAPAPRRRDRPQAPDGPPPLPLEGLKVLDLTAWWAGPSGAAVFAAMGAEVVHVESTRRIDGMRTAGGAFFGRDQWWEYSAFFLQANTNKYDVTLDLDRPEGKALALELAAEADIVIENYTPRVIENFGLDWPVIHDANPRAVMVRMPAFGLDGPWRDRPGFAQTMEQITGLAWMTGHPEDQPRIQRGPCDPNGGLHAVFAALVALERRERTGQGCLVEAPMFEAALNVAAEPVIEWTAYQRLVGREGNRSPAAAPQNLYACAGTEQWLALSCATDEQFRHLAEVLGRPELADDPELATLAGRRRHHDRLDDIVAAWAGERSVAEALGALVAAGVPAAPLTDSRRSSEQEQMQARGYFEPVDHPVVGTQATPGLPFRFASVDHWIRRPAPTLGQHNTEILGGWLGHDPAELAALEEQGVIGTWPQGA
ncbi:CaiB/BaiF CoA-transferase family protein [Rhabdothermincola salaria]|uniref:CaiB/BaiF CoA-transferase family protein n=1 Tax=Rhabdothermincola salaria TaxID=2903142 RepID=UPI001E3D1852|nr:CoA transferase [Rhabdothermincola salaria]MCD9624380.1 CoA transferase [Rhabdothermincola salaria]